MPQSSCSTERRLLRRPNVNTVLADQLPELNHKQSTELVHQFLQLLSKFQFNIQFYIQLQLKSGVLYIQQQ